MIGFDVYNIQEEKITEPLHTNERYATANEVMATKRVHGEDEIVCTGAVAMYISNSRFSPSNLYRFVFAVEVMHRDMNEKMLFMACLNDLDIVINRKTAITMVSLQAMQAIYAMQNVTCLTFDDAGKQLTEQMPITFLNAQVGPTGIQQRSMKDDALITKFNSCYVRLPHEHVYRVANDGRIAENEKARRSHLCCGDRIYLVFRLVPLEDSRYFTFPTSRGHFAWTARPGTVYPDIIACDRELGDGTHRLIGFVETVEYKSHIRMKLLLSTIYDARVIEVPYSF